MELKEINNRQTLKKYLVERQRILNSFEDSILHNLYIYFQEKQCFFLQKDRRSSETLEELKEKYQSYLSINSQISDFYLLTCNNEGEFWVKTNEVVTWNFENKKEWKPVFADKWNLFSTIFREKRDYSLLYEDECVKIVLLYTYIEEKPFISIPNQRLFYEIGYIASPYKKCDLFKEAIEDFSYSYKNNQETFSLLGIEEYYRLCRYYQEQEHLLKRNLRKSKIGL